MTTEALAFVVFIAGMLMLMGIGMNMAFALLLTGAAMAWVMDFWDTQLLAQNMVAGVDSFPLLAVPFFILAGELMNSGGISKRIIDMAQAWVGHVRGGLGYVAIGAAVLLSAMSGSALADAAAMSAILLPMMRKHGYPVASSAGLIAAGSVIGPIIPPSMAFVIYGVTTNTSISALFISGIVPGLVMGVALVVAWRVVLRKMTLTSSPPVPMAERLRLTGRAVWALIMPVIIIGGMKSGIFTPTEAAVVAAVYAFFVGMFVYRELKWGAIYPLIVSAAKTTAVVVFLIACALVSGWLITASDIPQQVSELLQPFVDSPILLMAIMMILVVIVGTALDFAPTLLILTPVLMPLVREAGIDPVYFGVLFIMNNAIGLITPPVGIVLNVVCGTAKLRMGELMKGLMPFLIAEIAVLFLLVLFPSIVLVPLRWLTG
eukprot:TRINITY_DN7332_c0_g1_i1.p1 TRINITY_DN7332_c0_g1~~TRINITY_DN7332_c0_g1_i1.p1  ORF type:complete len:432 (-),score=163.90 TRINITY_DN7332_c0_g1_i1:252-1547(-)